MQKICAPIQRTLHTGLTARTMRIAKVELSATTGGVMPLRAIAYVSEASGSLTVERLQQLVMDAVLFNESADVTGTLLFDGTRFLQYLEGPEAGVNAALNNPVAELRDTQKANLRVTQIWLRHVLWSLRLRLGYLVEEAAQASLTFRYPIVMARDLAASTRDLSVESMRVHGVGMTEKLYDVTTSLVDVLAGLPPATAQFPGEAGVGSRPEDDLAYLRGLIKKLPLGETTYDGLVEKHMQDVTPHLVRRSQMPDILMQT